ncbi:MAG: tetraacyldisaccharide 4'-kinase [bacterium]
MKLGRSPRPAFFFYQAMSRTKNYLDLVSGKTSGPLAAIARAFLAGLACGYALGMTLRNFAYDFGLKTIVKSPVPVVSIGNITTGGTGKTPMVEYVCRYFRQKGLRVAILSRGYGSGSGEMAGMNDEGLLLYQNLPDVPHLQDSDRAGLARIAVEELESHVLVLDDAHQHRRLARNLNIVLIDATNPFGFGWLLPRGLLREPSSQSLSRADAILITRCNFVSTGALESIENRVREKIRPGTPVARSIHQPVELLLATGEVQSLEKLKGKKAAVFCGLGNPSAFLATVEALGVQVIAEKIFTDHHQYSDSDIAELSEWVGATGAELALTSQKDLVKLVCVHLGGRPLGAIRIGLEITHGQAEINHLLDQMADQVETAPITGF